ncbi:hypothetical protein FB45DRAFT_206531 [Roridomyces roridus]|uniref:Uncharacterized protein n=1 Tax=Roridomyces roridus TaxID=1738132 RepID=A0AAD7CFW0_9AGAR|nr:hypothetical protein FB45DRAFT_206531 [Roridomyces roridus]
MTYEPKNIQSASTLRTKHRLGSQRFAPGIPRYISPPPSSNKDTATTVLDANMEASAGNADDFLELTRESLENGDGLYAPGEDPFASMRNEMTRSDMGEPIDDHALDEAAEEFLHIPETSEIHTTSVTWSGQFTITAPGYIVSQLVTKRATLIDSTSPTENDLPTLDSFLLPSQDLNLCKFYEVRDLVIAVPAFKPTQQFARLVAEDEDESFRTFVQYLSHKEQAALLPAVQKNQLLGYLFILPPSASNLLTALGSTSHSDQPPCLVVALVFLIAGSPPPRSRSVIPLQPREKLSQVANMHTELAYRFALCVTALPEHVLRYTLNHPSVVWSGATKDDLDTAHLRCALSKSRQGIIDAAGAGSKAGTVFIHVRALPFVHSLPDIVELRSRPEVRFYSYGTHPSVPPKRWGHRPIFLLGGIVTFSVAALTGDPWGLLRTIRRIAAHPLWECYLLPQIFGLALRLNEQREDSGMEELGDSGLPLALDRILDAVLEGQVALLCAPGSDPAEYLLKHLWSICRQDREQLLPIFRTDKDNLLERCRAACDAAFPDPAASFETAAEVVRADVRRMQTQPLLVETYRRYVVIDVGSNDQQDGIEWQDIGRFSFNDALDSSE